MGNVNLLFIKESQVDNVKRLSSHSHFLDRKLEVRKYENAYVLPKAPFNAGIITSDGNAILGTNACERYRVGYGFDKSKVQIVDEEVVYMGYLKSIFGHCITDDIKRCWFIGTEKWKQLKGKNVKCVYILPEDEKVSDVLVQSLNWFGEDINSWQRITEDTQFSKIYVPDCSLIYNNGERYFTKEFVKTVSLLKTIALKKSNVEFFPEKIYLSRTNIVEPGREMGEKAIEKEFKRNGYFIEHPEEWSLEDQIALMGGCTHLATTEGSIAHIAMFCSPGTQVAILRKADYVNTYQVAINELANLDVTYIDVHQSTVDDRWPWGGPFYLYKTHQLYKYLNRHQFVWPVIFRPSFWWYKLRQAKVMQQFISNRRLTKKIERFLFS